MSSTKIRCLRAGWRYENMLPLQTRVHPRSLKGWRPTSDSYDKFGELLARKNQFTNLENLDESDASVCWPQWSLNGKVLVNKAAHDQKQTSFIQLASLQKVNVVQNSKIKIIVNKAAHDRKQTSFIQLASLQKLNVVASSNGPLVISTTTLTSTGNGGHEGYKYSGWTPNFKWIRSKDYLCAFACFYTMRECLTINRSDIFVNIQCQIVRVHFLIQWSSLAQVTSAQTIVNRMLLTYRSRRVSQ